MEENFGLTEQETKVIDQLVDCIHFLVKEENGSKEDILSLVENIIDRM